VDPFKSWKPRGAPGSQTIGDFFAGPKKNKPTPVGGLTPNETLQLANYLQAQIEAATREVGEEAKRYTLPYPPGEGPPGAGVPQKKLLEDLGGLLLPKTYLKALTESGEGNIPLTHKVNGPGRGVGVNEEEAIRRQIAQQRADLEAYQRSLFPALSRPSAIVRGVSPFAGDAPSVSIQPGHIQPVNAAALANQEAAQGIAKVLVHERADP